MRFRVGIPKFQNFWKIFSEMNFWSHDKIATIFRNFSTSSFHIIKSLSKKKKSSWFFFHQSSSLFRKKKSRLLFFHAKKNLEFSFRPYFFHFQIIIYWRPHLLPKVIQKNLVELQTENCARIFTFVPTTFLFLNNFWK